MRQMEASPREVEIKLPFASPEQARAALRSLGATPFTAREFEDNVLFDRSHDPLKPQGKLLRLRRVGDRSVVTMKSPVDGEHRHKVRIEHETSVDRPEALERILLGLGLAPGYRYQKYRSEFRLGALHVCLDETPVGCFVELEGDPHEIDLAAEKLGFSQADYVRESYRELHEKATGSDEPGDMVFDDGASE